MADDWTAPLGRTVSLRTGSAAKPPPGLSARLRFVAALLRDHPPAPDDGPRLVWRDETGAVRVVPLGERVVIGRDRACEVVLAGSRVSRRHCAVARLHGAAWVSDLGSTNGTRLNGRLLAMPELLHDGDVMQLGGGCVAYLT